MTASALPAEPSDAEDLVARPYAHVRIRNLSGRIVVAVAGATVELADSAEHIWRSLAPGRPVRQVAAIVAELYDEPIEDVLPDVIQWVGEMHTAGFLALREPEGVGGA